MGNVLEELCLVPVDVPDVSSGSTEGLRGSSRHFSGL